MNVWLSCFPFSYMQHFRLYIAEARGLLKGDIFGLRYTGGIGIEEPGYEASVLLLLVDCFTDVQ